MGNFSANYNGLEKLLQVSINALDDLPLGTKIYARGNSIPFMSKSSTSAPMKRRQLRNKYVKNGSESNRLAFSKQCNYCVNFSRKNKRDYFANLENFVKH